MRKDHRSLDSFLISAIIHVIFIVILASYITIDHRIVESAISVAWVEVKDEVFNRPRPLLNESLLRKNLPRREDATSKLNNEFKSNTFAQALSVSPEVIKKSVELNPKGIQVKALPDVVTSTDSVLPGDISISRPVTTATGAKTGRGAVTGRVRAGGGSGGRGGLSIFDQNIAKDAGLMPETLKSPDKLPEDELGGMLVGKGSDISGHIRLIRLKHGLSDWWQDPTALTGLVDWLNKNTRIRADMKVAGGVLTLDDPQIFNAPIIFMTGHDRSVTMSNNLMRPERNGGTLASSLTPQEKAGLRQYLVDKGGMLFFDDCGFNGLFADEVKSILREALPEYSLENIPRTHEIFNCYYNLPGPPRGSEMFWGSENEGKGAVFPYLMGITIGRRLAVVFCRKDYLCAIETVEIPSHTQLRYRYSPDVYKFMTNLVVYAMKYGGITDRSDYN
ncbi:MAG: DUF4159 domain-containing protein [bacterium]